MAQKKANNGKLEVCYLLSYKTPDYTRTAALVFALRQMPDVDLTVIKNTNHGFLRYWQTLSGLISYRRRHKPDVFIVGFRGQEVFWLFYPFMRGRRIIFDEFVNHHDWIVDEHNKFGPVGKWLVAVLDAYMRWVVRRSTYVLEDTEAHAALSRTLYRAPAEKIVAIPVGANEDLFKPETASKNGNLEALFYGNMLPLHGINVILDSIKRLNDNGRIKSMHFTLIGGRGKPKMINLVEKFISDNELSGKLTYLEWVDAEKLPTYIAKADICLGGPFGGTGQARRVITGKTFQFLAMNRPSIIGETDNQGLFQDKKNCLIVPQNDSLELADALWWATNNRNRLEAIGLKGGELYKENFSSEVIGKTLHGLLTYS